MTTKEPASEDTWSVRLNDECPPTLCIRDEKTFDEYVRAIDANVCLGRCVDVVKQANPTVCTHTIFTYPRAIDIIRAILAAPKPDYTIERNPASEAIITITFRASAQIALPGSPAMITLEDSLVVDCSVVIGSPGVRKIAKLSVIIDAMRASADETRATIDAMHASADETRAVVAQLIESNRRLEMRVCITEELHRIETLFGPIPHQLRRFAIEIVRAQIAGDPYHLVGCTDNKIWLSCDEHIDVSSICRTENSRRHYPCVVNLLWVPCMIMATDPREYEGWRPMLQHIRASRIVVGSSWFTQILLNFMVTPQSQIKISSCVRSLVFGSVADIRGAWALIKNITVLRSDCEIILPPNMNDPYAPSRTTIGPNIKYWSDHPQPEQQIFDGVAKFGGTSKKDARIATLMSLIDGV